MFQKFLFIFPSLVWCIFLADKSEATKASNFNFEAILPQYFNTPWFSSVSGTAESSSVSGSSDISSVSGTSESSSVAGSSGFSSVPGTAESSKQQPAQYSFLIDHLARKLSDGLLNSALLHPYSIFREDQPHDLLFRFGSAFLERARIYDPALAEIAAAAVNKAGYLDSQLFFAAIGHTAAKFLFAAGFLKNEQSVTYFSVKIVSATELAAYTEGVFDTESMMNSVAGGLFAVFESLGLDTYNDFAELFYSFADEIDKLSTKMIYDFKELDIHGGI